MHALRLRHEPDGVMVARMRCGQEVWPLERHEVGWWFCGRGINPDDSGESLTNGISGDGTATMCILYTETLFPRSASDVEG